MKNIGIIYCAVGDENYYELALNSINSIEEDISISLFTDDIGYDFFKQNSNVNILKINSTIDKRAKLECFNKTPYDNTLYLDADTVVCKKLISDFKILKNFDIACCHDSMRYGDVKLELYNENKNLFGDIPLIFPEYNTGVIFYKKNKVTQELFKSWIDTYDIINYPDSLHDKIDQPSFRYALYYSSVNVSTLPIEYNVTPGLKKLYNTSPKSWNFKIGIEHLCRGYRIKIK